jgi:Ran-binding protein 1
MFGGGEKKEKKDDEDRGDNSGSAKAQREAKGEEVSCGKKSSCHQMAGEQKKKLTKVSVV